jgi:hypothetical protein
LNGTSLGTFNAYHSDKAPINHAQNALPYVGNASEYTNGTIALSNGVPYVVRDKKWYKINWETESDDMVTLQTMLKNQLNAFKTGGLADFTGPAWLDGTKSRPELVLNAQDTQNFIALKDILSDVMNNTSGEGGSSGDNYYDIQINVDSLGSDYDVEQLAEKLRKIIYEDATYRNVNVVNLIR